MANNVTSALDSLLTAGLSFYAPFADAGSGAVSLVASGAGASQAPTFTRATDATTVDENGLIVTVTSGTPRSYYDPTTLEYRGYLAEGARTNICKQSQDLTTTWASGVGYNSTISANSTTAPDGTVTADTLVADNAGGTGVVILEQTVTVSTATAYTFSIFAKAGTLSWIQMYLLGFTTPGNGGCFFNLSAGAVGTADTGITGSIKSYPNGWYRCSITFTTDAADTSGSLRVYLADGDLDRTVARDGVSSAYLWGAQLEAGTFASSYIPTTASAVTRNADVLTYPFSGNADATVGTAYAELSTLWATAAENSVLLGFGVTVNGMIAEAAVAATVMRVNDGTNTASKTGLSNTSTGLRKRASSWGSELRVTGDGLTPATATFDGAMASVAIAIGCETNGVRQWFGPIKNVRIWKNQFTAAQLQAITSG